MDLSCPSCATTFRIDPELIGSEGRSVRCGSCGHSWRQMRPEAVPSEAPSGAVVGTAAASTATPSDPQPGAATVDTPTPPPKASPTSETAPEPEAAPPTAAQPPVMPTSSTRTFPPTKPRSRSKPVPTTAETSDTDTNEGAKRPDEDQESQAEKRPTPEPATERKGSGGWFTFVVVVAALAAIAYFGRERIIEQAPRTAGLYALVGLGPAPIADVFDLKVKHKRRMEGGQTELIIEGTIANLSMAEQTIPTLRARLTESDGTVIFEQDFEAEAKTLAPGGSVSFRTSMKDPARAVVVEVLLIQER